MTAPLRSAYCRLRPLAVFTGTSGYPRMHRFVDSAVPAPISPIAIAAVLPSPCQDKVGTRKR